MGTSLCAENLGSTLISKVNYPNDTLDLSVCEEEKKRTSLLSKKN